MMVTVKERVAVLDYGDRLPGEVVGRVGQEGEGEDGGSVENFFPSDGGRKETEDS